ncbi:MAG: hypothetical protein M1820_003980 [Bogoriella megaspora]|nr:MAG: hypothetical protein M1820_003980 [Bogoriella megaspora]
MALYAWDHAVDDRLKVIAEKLSYSENQDFEQTNVPGLRSLLDDKKVTYIEFHRRLLQVFRDSKDQTYEGMLGQHTKDEIWRLEEFVDGADPEDICEGFEMGPSLGCREELNCMEEVDSLVRVSGNGIFHIKSGQDVIHIDGLSSGHADGKTGSWFHEQIQKIKAFFHLGSDDHILVYQKAAFQNWGLNISNVPFLTCVPTSVKAIQQIVKYAVAHDMGVRCSGYRHSWAPIFGRNDGNGQIIISVLNLSAATKLPNITALPLPESKPTELESIEIVKGKTTNPGNYLVRVGCATTNERLRRWCVEHNKVTIPFNVIMVEMTLGGSNAPICHGAGRGNQTLSDIVRKIEYVDAHGKLQSIDNMDHLRAASGCFGLVGIVTHITMEFPPMTYAEMVPLKIPVIRAIPPPPDMTDEEIQERVPPSLRQYWDRLTPAERQQDQQDFETRATNDYYSEWFWFPFSDYSWVNTWNHVPDPHGAEDWPSDVHIFLSFAQTFLMNVLQSSPLLDSLIQATNLSEAAVTLISHSAMLALPTATPSKPIKTFLCDALHFQRAIQNVRVRDLEVEMPLISKPNSSDSPTPDYTLVQRAWWDAIFTVYEPENRKTCPMRMPLEMRIMGDSNVVLAPQRGNALGTCAIEVLTLHNAADIWEPFAQQVLDKWMGYTDPSTGRKLNTRPHWAKEWVDFKVEGRPWGEKLKGESYREEITEFKGLLGEIGRGHGWTLGDSKRRFSNDFFDGFFFDDVAL